MSKHQLLWKTSITTFLLLACAATATAQVHSLVQVRTRSNQPRGQLQVVPEYERRLNRVLLLIPAAEAGEARRRLLLEATYREILAVLPSSTIVELAVSRKDEAMAREVLQAVGARESTELHVVSAQTLDAWAQDAGEPVFLDGEPHFLVSAPHSVANSYNHALSTMRVRLAKDLFGALGTVQANFFFEAGNWTFDRAADGSLKVFVGYNDVAQNLAEQEARGRHMTQREVLQSISSLLGGADVVLVGKEPQSEYLFHLDQAFVLLKDRTAVVARIERPKDSAEARQLIETHRALQAEGYRTFAIPHSLDDIKRYRTSVNAVPFVDAEGRKRVLYPVFQGELSPDARKRPLTKDDLLGKARVAYEVYETAGYDPIPVPDFVSGAGGSLHCILNVLD